LSIEKTRRATAGFFVVRLLVSASENGWRLHEPECLPARRATAGFSLGQPIARGYALPAKSVRMQRLRAEHRYSGQQMRNR
jgi:hypothetical protein